MNYTLIDLYHIRYALQQEITRKKIEEQKDHVIKSYKNTLRKTEEILKEQGYCEVKV